MKRLLISSLVVIALGFAGTAAADNYRGSGHPPGIQKQLDRGKALPPGHQKKFMKAHYRRDHHDRHHKHRDRRYRDSDHRHHHRYHSRYDRRDYRDKHRNYRDRHDRYRYRDGYRTNLRYDDHLPPEHRVARIIRDTHALIEDSRR